MNKSPKLYLPASLVLAVLVAAWFLYPSGMPSANAALAEYQIERLTCGSCVNNIEKALLGLDGVASVEVNLTSNRGRVTFDPVALDSRVIAETISAAGYPATLRLELDALEYADMQQEQSHLGQKYLAKIGTRLLSRSDFEQLLMQRSPGPRDQPQDERVLKLVWNEMLQRELLLSAAERNRVIVQEGEVDARLDELRKQHQELDQVMTERYGSVDGFRKILREDMTISRIIDDHAYAGNESHGEKQAKLQNWYANLEKNTEVIIYDPRLKALGDGDGGCACCNRG